MLHASIFDVTSAMRNLVWFNLRRIYNAGENDVDVTFLPPEDVTALVPTINIYLYHLSEDPLHRNAVGYENVSPAIAGQPMALRLFYVMTTHLETNGVPNPQERQEYMSAAMKTFHDYPVLDAALALSFETGGVPQPIMPTNLANTGHRIEIALRNLEPEENINFWATEDQKTPRLAAYYEVRTVFIEPEMTTSVTGTVFDVGLYVNASSAARLMGSRAFLNFQMPAETGLGPQSLDVVPARAVLRAAPHPDQERVRLTGNSLTTGDARRLRLIQNNLSFEVDSTLNPDWDIRFETGEISFIPQAVLNVTDGVGGSNPQPIIPGQVEFALEIIAYRFQGTTRLESTYEAGRVSVAVGARITNFTGPVGTVFRLNVEPVVTLTGAQIMLAVDGEYYTEDSVNAQPVTAGTYVLEADHILIQPHLPAPLTGAHSVQLFVNGAESQPFWIEAGP
ncbi:MAG: Pvc16 family protein [Pseudomonadota bacterium]